MSEKNVGPFYYVGENGFEAWGFTFPSGFTILEWDKSTVPDDEETIDGHHQSVYESFEDMRKICTGSVDWGVYPGKSEDADDNVTAVCEVCGDEFETVEGPFGWTPTFCSWDCLKEDGEYGGIYD